MRLHHDRKVKLLEHVPLFDGCSDNELARIAKLADETTYDDGASIVREGRVGHQFVVIVEGEVAVLANGERKGTLGPGSYFGEISLMEHTARTATVVAEGRVRVLTLDEEAFDTMLSEVSAVRGRLDRAALERLVAKPPEQRSG